MDLVSVDVNLDSLASQLNLQHKMQKLARVSSKGQVVIPAKIRRKLKISRTVLIREEKGRVILEPSMSMEEAFGSGGKIMRQVAIEISRDRRKEVRSERKMLSF